MNNIIKPKMNLNNNKNKNKLTLEILHDWQDRWLEGENRPGKIRVHPKRSPRDRWRSSPHNAVSSLRIRTQTDCTCWLHPTEKIKLKIKQKNNFSSKKREKIRNNGKMMKNLLIVVSVVDERRQKWKAKKLKGWRSESSWENVRV